MKSLLYASTVDSDEALIAIIAFVACDIQEMPGYLQCSAVHPPAVVMINIAENYETTATIMINPPLCLTQRSRKETITIISLCGCPPNEHPSCSQENFSHTFTVFKFVASKFILSGSESVIILSQSEVMFLELGESPSQGRSHRRINDKRFPNLRGPKMSEKIRKTLRAHQKRT
ncbi:hypothetical protein TNCV_2871621 [Trichonephila clavipes]|nr:hypothetical protein TNCV_2871621 [Trichonephila clavipes]